jgi:hypothetical protein
MLIINLDSDDFNYIINSGESSYTFLSKTLLEINDFDCLINEKTYKLFSKIFQIEEPRFSWAIEYIEGILYERMLLLFIPQQKRIKAFYQGDLEGNFQLIQLNIEFYVPESDDVDTSYYNFISLCCGCEEILLELFNNNAIGYMSEFPLRNDSYICIIYNNNLFKKSLSKKEIKIIKDSFENINNPRIIGLENIGAT